MGHTNRALAALAALVALWAAVVTGCGGPAGGGTVSPTPPADGRADITGVIHDLTRTSADDGGWPILLIVADPSVAGSVDRAMVRVTAATTVWAPAGEGRTTLSAADLVEGQRVAVRFSGPVAESYPVQAAAGDIEVLSPL